MSSNDAFKVSVLRRDLSEARRLLHAGADPDVVVGEKRGRKEINKDILPDGFTALHVAAYHDDAELCELLLEFKADLHAKTRFGATPIEIAVAWGSPAALRILLGAGVDLNSMGRLLPTAAGRGDVGMVELLLTAGTRRGLDEALSLSCGDQGNIETLRALVDAGAEPAFVRPPDWSARVVALERRRFDCLALLRERFPPRTLIDAVIDGDVDDLEDRLRAGANIDEPLHHGITALGCAARMGLREIARRLIAAGATIDQRTLWGTPVSCALVAGHLELASELHALGASLADLHGPLLHARASAAAFAWLCSKQPPAKLDVLLCTAVALGDLTIIRLLLSLGAHPNGVDAWGRCALSLAVAAEQVEIIRLLLDAGADPKARDRNGHPILHYVLTYDGASDDWLDPDFDCRHYDRESPVLRSEAVCLILERGAPLPWDDD